MKLFVEILESLGLVLCLLLAAPLGFFRRLDSTFTLVDHAGFLIKRGLFASLLRARLDYKMGNYQQSVVLLSPLVNYLELFLNDKPAPFKIKRLLCTLYCDLQQLYLLGGQIEDAAQVVIRAHSHLGIDRLPTNPDLDIKSAHVVKAGLAASKLLDEGGLATLMLRQGDDPAVGRPQTPKGSKSLFKRTESKPREGAIIIPFPAP